MSLEYTLNKKQKIVSYSDSYLVAVTFQEITDIENNRNKYKLKNPIFQVTFDENKTDEMVESYDNYPRYLLSKSVITLANVIVGGEKEMYLMDGQHRMAMVKQIYEKTNQNDTMFFAVHTIYSDDEMRVLFDEINKDSSKNKPYVSLEIFGKKKIEDVKTLLVNKYKGAYSKTKNNKSTLHTVDDFLNDLIDNEYFEDNEKNANEIVNDIDTKHKKYFTKLKYLENADDNKLYTPLEMITIKEQKNVMFFKNNNFTNYLINNDYPFHDDATRRKTIPVETRKKVWSNEFGNKKTGMCPVAYCEHEINNKKFGFQCGHKISVANKGSNSIDNLKPICSDCNSKMSSTNWHDYEEELEKEQIWENNYDDDSDGECYSCDKKVKRETFCLKKVKTKKGKDSFKISCNKCYKK